MISPPPFIVVRHGQTQMGAEGRFQGHLPVGLDETGSRQAEVAGRELAAVCGSGEMLGSNPRIISSSLPRAMETAFGIARCMGIPPSAVSSDPALREMAFGLWEGMTSQEVKARYPELRRARKKDRWNFAAHGGESYADLAGRIGKWMKNLTFPSIIVAHSGTIRVMGHLLAGWNCERAMMEKIAHCEAWTWKNNEFIRL